MKHKARSWMILALLMLMALLLVIEAAPGWGMPEQNAVRQTVPEMTPQVYLPVVVRNFGSNTP